MFMRMLWRQRARPPACTRSGVEISGSLAQVGFVALLSGLVVLLNSGPAPLAAAMLFVDQSNRQCSDSGVGTLRLPFCSIGAAASHVSAGDVVVVRAGTYNEEVLIEESGTEDSPIIFVADNDVTVLGQNRGFVLQGVTLVTVQGFEVSDTISHGIQASNCSQITIFNNRIIRSGGRGVYIRDSSDAVIADNLVTRSGQPLSGLVQKGIVLSGVSDSVVSRNTLDANSDSGIYLSDGTTRVHVVGNTSMNNARGYVRAAPGIEVRNAFGNIIEANIARDNEDTGIQLYEDADNMLILSNLAFHNGDHGIDVKDSANTHIIANNIYNNETSGINIEGTSTGAMIFNNISIDNALDTTRQKGNIAFNRTAIGGALADYNMVYLSAPGVMYQWDSIDYPSLRALQAANPGIEVNGIEADPLWRAPAAYDFHLTAVSPAIDSADASASGASSSYIDRQPRVDAPAIPNTGAGPRDYHDRGAYEFHDGVPPVNTPPQFDSKPVASPNLVTSSQTAELSMVASDADDDPLEYDWNVASGDGIIVGSGPTVTYIPPEVSKAQIFRIAVEITDGRGGSLQDSIDVTVVADVGSGRRGISFRPLAETWAIETELDAN